MKTHESFQPIVPQTLPIRVTVKQRSVVCVCASYNAIQSFKLLTGRINERYRACLPSWIWRRTLRAGSPTQTHERLHWLRNTLRRRTASPETASERIWKTSPRQTGILHNVSIATSYSLIIIGLITASGQSNLTQGCIAAADGRFNRIRYVPPMWAYWRHLANMIDNCASSSHPSPQPKWQIDRFSRFAQFTAE